MKKLRYPSLLLMESHGFAPNVRTTSFSSVNVWSKLYQAGPFFLDIALRPGESGLHLRGELLSGGDGPMPTGCEIELFDADGSCAATPLGEDGFVLPIERVGTYRLEVSSDQMLIGIEDLEIG